MEQHPVPQPITSYEFRLVGDMTLKQFGKLAVGIILALIVYAINPPGLLKWFLIILFSTLGVGMAFFPFGGRPIDAWIMAFFKRIYSPTQYVWKQRGAVTQAAITPPIAPAKTTFTPPPLPTTTPAIPKPITETVLKPAAPLPKFVPPPPPPMARKVEARFIPNIVIPAMPTMPNLLAGFIHDKEGKIIEGAILEIRDSQGNPVRAFKTNKLGQFLSATPLHSGSYEIETEKEGFEFDIIKINLEGKILSPIEIVSKN